MTYNDTITYLETIGGRGSQPGLERIQTLLGALGNPQKELSVIHIAGTNGKGSTASFITRILMEAGLKVGLFTSPHLERFEDTIRINTIPVDEDKFSKWATWVQDASKSMEASDLGGPTQFECLTAIALLGFQQEGVQIAVIEAGLGGALDSTNVFENPLVSVLTPIDMDHVQFLGDSIEAIAQHKAGIIKANSVTVSAEQRDEVLDVAAKQCNALNNRLVIAPTGYVEIVRLDERGSTFKLFDHTYDISLIGAHQIKNAVLAMTVIGVLKETYGYMIEDEHIIQGLFKTTWPGRLELICKKPAILIDGAHNVHGVKALSDALKDVFAGKRIIGVMGVLKDKDYAAMVSEVTPYLDDLIVTEPDNPRKLSAVELSEITRSFGKVPMVEPDIKEAIERAMQIATDDDLIVVFGSLYLLPVVRRMLCSIFM